MENKMKYLLRFTSSYNPGRGFTFPCDEHGYVDTDTLSTTMQESFYNAWTQVGFQLLTPTIEQNETPD